MKQTWKQIFRAVLLALSVLLCTACPAWAQAQEEVDEDMRITLTSTAESLSQTIVELSQEEIDDYRESGDEFTVNTMEVWENSRKELGEFESMGESMVEKTTTGYSVKIPAQFSERNAEIVYLFDQTGVPISFSMDIQYPLSALLKRAGMNTLMGLGIVFAMLIFLKERRETAKRDRRSAASGTGAKAVSACGYEREPRRSGVDCGDRRSDCGLRRHFDRQLCRAFHPQVKPQENSLVKKGGKKR